jgi:uncharacterized membrane protein
LGEAARSVEEGVARLLGVPHPKAQEPGSQDPLRLFLEGRVDDRRLVERVEAALGHLSSRPNAIRAWAREGVVTLEGRVLESEVTDVVFGVRRVPGLVRLESRMQAVRNFEDLDHPQVKIDLSPTGMAAARAAAGMLAVAALERRNLLGLALVLGAGFVVARATGWRPGPPRWGGEATVSRTVEIEAPVERVFGAWSSFRNVPRFASGVVEVREREAGLSHWVGTNEEGRPITWDVEITALKPHRCIAWRSVEGSPVSIAGEAEFEALDAARTRLTVTLSVAGAEPLSAEQLAADLERFSELMSGAAGGGQLTGSEAPVSVSQEQQQEEPGRPSSRHV